MPRRVLKYQQISDDFQMPRYQWQDANIQNVKWTSKSHVACVMDSSVLHRALLSASLILLPEKQKQHQQLDVELCIMYAAFTGL